MCELVGAATAISKVGIFVDDDGVGEVLTSEARTTIDFTEASSKKLGVCEKSGIGEAEGKVLFAPAVTSMKIPKITRRNKIKSHFLWDSISKCEVCGMQVRVHGI